MQRTKLFVILDCFFCLFTTPSLKPKKSKFWKTNKNSWKYYHFTHVYHKWQSYDVWFLRYGVWQTEFFVILDHFLLLYPCNNPKNQNFEKIKKSLQILSFCTCVTLMTIIWCMVTEISSMTEFFIILDHFLPFYAPNNHKNQNFENL